MSVQTPEMLAAHRVANFKETRAHVDLVFDRARAGLLADIRKFAHDSAYVMNARRR